ncbi:MAG TPA: sigma-70 family RNA polymerase sigma factor [Gaiellaceae bacterium]|nr:sigma-70 family RNA polymerase sigma factor [Gaiellaceae bacterium]
MSTALLARSAAPDRAFERLYRRHVHDVYRYVLAVLRNQADAEDATQATFLSAYRAFMRGEEPLKPRNWLLKIAHNECRQRFRAASRRPVEVAWDDERGAAPGVDETVPTADEIRSALAHLSFNQRSALVMRELEGRSYNEIAAILGLSVSAIETLLFRARRALREQLEGALTCGEAEAALSRRLDGRLALAEQRALRAHLRECRECAVVERKQRARRAAVKRLGAVHLPPSLAGFLGGGGGSVTAGGVVAGSGLVAKAAAVVAAGVVAGGAAHEAVDAIAAADQPRKPARELRQAQRQQVSKASAAATAQPAARGQVRGPVGRKARGTTNTVSARRVRAGVTAELAKRRGAPAAPANAVESAPAPATSSAPAAAPPSSGSTPATPVQPPAAPQPVQEVTDSATGAVGSVPLPTPPNLGGVVPPTPPVPPVPQLPQLPVPVPPVPPPPLP